MNSRRGFLRDAALTAATVCTVPVSALASFQKPATTKAVRGDLNQAGFAELVGSDFRMQSPENGRKIVVRLQQAELQNTDPQLDTFVLHFEAPGGNGPAQGTYPFQHPRLGRFDMFIVPAGLGTSAGFNAVFNRLRVPS